MVFWPLAYKGIGSYVAGEGCHWFLSRFREAARVICCTLVSERINALMCNSVRAARYSKINLDIVLSQYSRQ